MFGLRRILTVLLPVNSILRKPLLKEHSVDFNDGRNTEGLKCLKMENVLLFGSNK